MDSEINMDVKEKLLKYHSRMIRSLSESNHPGNIPGFRAFPVFKTVPLFEVSFYAGEKHLLQFQGIFAKHFPTFPFMSLANYMHGSYKKSGMCSTFTLNDLGNALSVCCWSLDSEILLKEPPETKYKFIGKWHEAEFRVYKIAK